MPWQAISNIGQFVVILASLLFLVGRDYYYTKNFPKTLLQTAAISAWFLIQRGLVSYLKNTVYSERPNGQGHDAFPSGHTTVVFFAVGVLFSRKFSEWQGKRPNQAKMPVLALILALLGACLVAAARYYSHCHWFIDIVSGALIGLTFGTLAEQTSYRLIKSRKK